MARPAWLPASIPTSALVGLVVAGVSYKWGRGSTRELGMAAGIGMMAAGVVPKVADAVGGLQLGGTTTQTPALAARRVFALPKPQGTPAQAAIAAARTGTSNRNILS
jgi:hypothetical protein